MQDISSRLFPNFSWDFFPISLINSQFGKVYLVLVYPKYNLSGGGKEHSS